MYALWIFDSTMSGVRLDSSNVCLSLTWMRPVGAFSVLGAARGLGAAGAIDAGTLAGADARIAVAARAAATAATDGDRLATFADVGDLLAEVGARAALAHVAFARAVARLRR